MTHNFSAPRFIETKRDRGEHSLREIEAFVDAVTTKKIEHYQISAWLMAALLNGLNERETSALTLAMSRSGKTLNWEEIDPKFRDTYLVDKHSTGGVGDKVSLVLAPLAAAMGLTVPMMSGQGLAQTGGTVDKLLSIPGFNMDISTEQMSKQLLSIGTCMIRQTAEFCPADKTLYALRDVTGTVPSVSLITASILSKKIAEGIHSLVIDLKTGRAAFMKNIQEARVLAKSLVRVSKEAGLKTHAVLTNMDSPLGSRVGNAIEVEESLEILKQSFPSDVHKRTSAPLEMLCLELCAEMAVVSGLSSNIESAKALALKTLHSGKAYEKFLELCHAQGAQGKWQESLPSAKIKKEIRATESGYVANIDALKIGWLGVEIGVGRAKAEDKVDPSAGFEFFVKTGDKVSRGDLLATLHFDQAAPNIELRVAECFELGSEPLKKDSPTLVLERIYDV
jgi:pyrimidine-nucleoside phosphorylase